MLQSLHAREASLYMLALWIGSTIGGLGAIRAEDAGALRPELVVQAGHTSPVNVVSFSPDGKLLASGSGDDSSWVEVNAVKLWDVATGTELRTLIHSSAVKWIGFSPDGRRIAARGASGETLDKARVWDIVSGAELPDAEVGPEYVSLAASPDGKVAADIDVNDVKLRDVASGQPLRTLASRTSDFQKVKFSPDSTILASGGTRHSIRLWDLRSGTLRTLVGHTDYPIAADFSPDSRLFASGGRDLSVRIWDVASGREIHKIEGHVQFIGLIKFSPDGKSLLCMDRAGFKLWEVANGRELVAVAGDYHATQLETVRFSPQGSLLAADVKGEVRVWNTETGNELRRLAGGGSLRFTPDGKVLAASNFDKMTAWNVASGKQIVSFNSTPGGLPFIRTVFSPDGKTLAVSEYVDPDDQPSSWRLYLIDVATGRLRRTITVDAKEPEDPFGGVAFTTDSREVMNVGNSITTLWDVGTGQKLRTIQHESDYLARRRQELALAPHYRLENSGEYCPFSANGAYYASIGNNGELHLKEPKNDHHIATLIGIDEKDWLVITKEGFFDGSPEAWKRIIWRFNNDTFNYAPLEAFFNEFYYPGLLPDVLAGKRPALPDGKDLSQIDRRQPLVTVIRVDGRGTAVDGTDSNERTVRLAIDVEENATAPTQSDQPAASGARDVRLFRNGSLVKAWRGDVYKLGAHDGCKLLGEAGIGKGKLMRCEIEVPLVAGANEFTAYAFNNANVKSSDAKLTINGAESLRREATLHVLAIGVNQHDYQPLNLRFAVADAQAFAAEVDRHQKELRNFARVETKLLLDRDATKQTILASLAELSKQVQPEDAAIVYFAGHGTAHENQFYLIPHDIGYAEDSPKVKDDGLQELLRRSVSDRELERAFEQVDAAQILLVIDACNSGQALEAEENRRGPMNSKGLAQLAYEKGMYVLTAAQGFQAAQEVSKLGHGLLTYVLVEEGLKRSAANAGPGDDRIDMREWLDYATRRVPQVQLHEMELASARGGNLAFADEELKMSLGARSAQRPRVFYRSEATPMVMAIAGTATTEGPADADIAPAIAQATLHSNSLAGEGDGIKERGYLGVFRKGPAEDLKAEIVEEQSGVYHTINRTQAVLGTYGKMIEGNRLMGRLARFEHRGLVQQLDHVRRFATVQRKGQSAGKDFLSLAGSRQQWQFVNLGAKLSGSRQNEVAFEIVGVRLDQTDIIKALNADVDALTYFDYLKSKEEAPCVVLENLVFTNYATSQGGALELGVTAKTTVAPDSVDANMANERSSSTEFTAPVIRCYQSYKVKLHQSRVVELVSLDP